MKPFNRSTAGTAGLSDEERLSIVYPFIVTARGTGNFMSFQLARAVKDRELSTIDIDQTFQLWFAKSRPFLPPDADETEWLGAFYRQLNRVRFTATGLEAACQRAAASKLPLITARHGDINIAKLAALCRELQRQAGARLFICPVNVVQQFLGLRWPTQANYLLHVLEEEGVIECVDRGLPNKPKKKGKPTLWRYKYPLGEAEKT